MGMPVVEGLLSTMQPDMHMQQLAKELLSRKDARISAELEARAVSVSKAEFNPWLSE